jgi:hypothetical protein
MKSIGMLMRATLYYNPLNIKSQLPIGVLTAHPEIAGIKTAIKDARASRESAAVINYLAWLLRTVTLVAE